MNYIISINPQWVKLILNQTKIIEYRKALIPKGALLYIYETSPTCKIVGEAIVEDSIKAEKELIWSLTHDIGGITKDFFDVYYKDKQEACVMELTNVIRYEKPKYLKDFGLKSPPQSFFRLEGL